MKKLAVIVAVLLCTFMFAGVTTASPLTDYSAGKVALDVNWTPNNDIEANGYSIDGKNANFDYGLTAGLGNKWAIQYRYFNPVSKDYGNYHAGVRSQEVNLLYQLDKNLSAFAGWHQAKITTNAPGFTLDNKSTWQVGLIGTTALSNKTSLYGIVGAGGSLFSAEAGFAYALNKDLDVNLFYRYKRIDDLKVNDYELDTTTKGFGLGLTYRF
jgi:opacity protein-like surface antigen